MNNIPTEEIIESKKALSPDVVENANIQPEVITSESLKRVQVSSEPGTVTNVNPQQEIAINNNEGEKDTFLGVNPNSVEFLEALNAKGPIGFGYGADTQN